MLLEPVDVDGEAALLGELDGQLEREAVGVVELEGVLAGDVSARGDLVEELQAARERLREALLLGGQRGLDLRAVLLELGIGGAHVRDHGAGEPGEERRFEPDPLAVLHRAADDPAQDVAAPLVPRERSRRR